MTTVVVFLVGLVIGAWIGALALALALALVRRDAPLPEPFPEAAMPTPRPEPEPVEVVDPPSHASDRVALTLMSTSGQCLGRVSIARRLRKPTFSYRPRGAAGLYHFVAERADGEGFIYRQVGQDRA